MQAPLDNLIPPIQYPSIWLIIGMILAAASVVWAIAAIITTRPARPQAVTPRPPVRPQTLNDIRARYEQRIRAIEAGHAEGSIARREGHLQLSAVVREYAQETRGIDAPVMTLQELQGAGLEPVSGAVALFYPAEFMPGELGDIPTAAQTARQVVLGWS